MRPFPNKKYEIIYADPPWDYRGFQQHDGKSKTSEVLDHYPTMSLKELCELNVKDISAGDCLLFIWFGSPILPDCMRLINAWGFTYITIGFVWDKMIMNPGNYTMSQTEMCIISKKGKIPTPRGARNIRQLVQVKRTRHSEKPAEVRNRIVQMFPTQERIELFARGKYDGWDVWGNEVTNK